MPTPIVVTPRQVLAAQIAVERAHAAGRPTSPAVRAIAAATVSKKPRERHQSRQGR